MKILQAVGWYFPESVGGTEVYVAALCRRLRGSGHDVWVAAPEPGGERERLYVHDGVPVYRYPIPAAPTRDECQDVTTARGAERFHRWLAEQRPDVVHAHTFVTGLGLHELQAARACGARVIATNHSGSVGWVCQRGTMLRWGKRLCDGVCRPAKCAACALQARGVPRPVADALGAVPPSVGRAGWLDGRLGTALAMTDLIVRNQAKQRAMLAVVDRFVLLGEWALAAAVANGAPREKLAVNRLGLSQTGVAAKPGPDENPTQPPIRVGYLGRFERVKGAAILAQAVAALPKSVPIRVEFRGPVKTDEEHNSIRHLRELVNGDCRVSFASPVTPADVPGVLASYDVLCCPSLTVEGGPTVVIEAHAVGTPVIGTRIGGLAELITDGHNGCLLPLRDWRALRDVLERIARDAAGTIDCWRRRLPPVRTMDEVVSDYMTLYGR
jgi:glycosyltransferase involved in cell wall biosynthesis